MVMAPIANTSIFLASKNLSFEPCENMCTVAQYR